MVRSCADGSGASGATEPLAAVGTLRPRGGRRAGIAGAGVAHERTIEAGAEHARILCPSACPRFIGSRMPSLS